ncbi:MAG: flagellar assembly protein FliW [Syntrophomonadaceae bacterium]|nr:flagellar assembly protein FliW [Syntrophomonadaceae bacterium]
MKIKSTLLGELEYEEKDLIDFPVGIPAFENEKSFLVIAMEEGAPFYYLHSVTNADLCMVMANPFVFFSDYTFEIGDEQVKQLECEDKREDLAIYVLLTIAEDFRQSTANLLAPITINSQKRKGLQFIAVNSDYKTRHYIFPQAQAEIAATAQEG